MSRFTKIGPDGQDVADDSTDHVAVRDNAAGLTWASKVLKAKSHGDAMKKASSLKLLGGGWRAPTRSELLTLVDDTRCRPATYVEFFPDTPTDDWYWTSTPAAYSPSDVAWFVLFSSGNSDWSYHGDSGFVRAVRVSQ